MHDRHKKLGIKQTIQLNWMDYTLEMLLAGTDEKEIRAQLDTYLSHQKQSGGYGKRGQVTYSMAIPMLAAWFAPVKELIPFRDHALELARVYPASQWRPLHWAVLSASYPFWFGVARQTGRLLNFQDLVTQRQIFNRVKEEYGDRETVSRNARYTVRSFVAWDVLSDTATKGSYSKGLRMEVSPDVAVLLYEAVLHTAVQKTSSMTMLEKNPGLFPFVIPSVNQHTLQNHKSRIAVTRQNYDEVRLTLVQAKA